eukprot:scaffold3586_cov164-Amphora_coffeaeformis.AAC.4
MCESHNAVFRRRPGGSNEERESNPFLLSILYLYHYQVSFFTQFGNCSPWAEFETMRLLSSSSIQRLCVPLSSFRVLSSAATRTPTVTTPDAELSRRRQFKQIPVDPKLLQYILEQQLSKSIRQKKSRKMARFIGAATRTPTSWIEQQQRYKQEQQQRQQRGRRASPAQQKGRESAPQKGTGTTATGAWQIQQQRRGQSNAQKGTPTTWQQQDPRRRGSRSSTAAAAPQPRKPQGPPLPFGPKANPVRIRRQIRAMDSDISGILDKLNPRKFPVVALCGRSNVGKSTLLNALLYGSRSIPGQEEPKKRHSGRHNSPIPLPKGAKATMSPTPGETKDITFYELSSSSANSSSSSSNNNNNSNDSATATTKGTKRVLWLADLPGYGFAQASEELLASYRELMATYICHKQQRPQRVLLLLDARHGMKQTDRAFWEDLQKRSHQLPALQIVLTKCDLVEATDLARRVTQVQQDVDDLLRRQPSRLPVLLTSATKRNGILAVQKDLAGLARDS